uniref:sulfatase-like hydrolase/transferase n=1 Tax=Sulfurovum sp. TaxID=1969726 RepID=UPI002867CF76
MKILHTLSVVTLGLLLLTPMVNASGLSDAVKTKENMEASIPRPAQEKSVQKKLVELEKKTGKKPNVVLIVADDLGFGDPGVYGGGEIIGAATPNIDKMAQEGLKLTSAYSQPTCTPTRAAILTGRLPVRTGLYRPILAGKKKKKNPWADEKSLPTILGEVGYN